MCTIGKKNKNKNKKIAKRLTLFMSRLLFPDGLWGKKPNHFFVFIGGIFGTSGHHCQPLGVLVPSFGTFLTVCPVRESSGSQCSWLNCLFDSTSSKLSPGVGGRVVL